MAGILTSRLVAWLILGGGGLAVIAMLWSGGVARGVNKEAEKWRAAATEKVKETRDMNFKIDQQTIGGDADLNRVEQAIRDKWVARKADGGAK